MAEAIGADDATASTGSPSLRERTRRAVQGELIDVAQRLFVDQGYEATTVDQIATAAGMSKRSFFRYFASKEELVLSKYERTGEDLAAALRSRPDDEPLWLSLRHTFDVVVDYATDRHRAAAMGDLERVIAASESLRGAYLARIDRIQRDLATIARHRSQAGDRPWNDDDPAPSAIVGAAFACLAAATATSARTGTDLGAVLDAAMAAVAPLH
jgi:AcrR family transcriptional regulator